MRTPHQVWHKSLKPYRESLPAWHYACGSEVKEVGRTGQLRLNHHRYYVSKALAGREVGLLEVEQRILVYYRRTLICELDPLQIRSVVVADPRPATVSGV